jgi:methyl-accepting chemotaxis protein/sigma-B regulation protein RsbU (phosphoserine phosphatase)
MLKKLRNIAHSTLKLNLTVVCETVLLLAVTLGVMLYFSRQALKEEAIHDAEDTLAGTVQQIDNVLLSIEQTTENIYQDLLGHLNEPERMETYCRKVVECNPYIVGCAIVFQPYFYQGRELFMAYIHHENDKLVSSDTFGPKPYTEQVWYTKPMASQRAGWTDPFDDENIKGGSLTTFCLPIFVPAKNGERSKCVGVMAVDLATSLLSHIVLTAKSSPNSYSVLLGGNGRYMIHPDAKKMAHKTVFTVIEEEAEPTVKEAGEAMMAGETGYKAFEMYGKDWYVFYKPFPHHHFSDIPIEPMKWSVGEVCPKSDIFGTYNKLLFIVVGIGVLGLLVFFLLCHVFMKRQLQPLHQLRQAAQRIADGNYSELVPSTDRDDEIGELQERFRKMQQSVVAYVNKDEQLKTSLQHQGEILQKTSGQAIENDKVKTAFLHYISNQMIMPGDLIDKSVTKICNNYQDISLEEMEQEMGTLKKQSSTILNLLGHIIKTIQIESGKEDSHE